MANPEHVKILKQGVDVWNKWRKENPDVRPDLKGSYLLGSILVDINFEGALLTDVHFGRANLKNANLKKANLRNANFFEANLCESNLESSMISNSSLVNANVSSADLFKANLESADLNNANLSESNLSWVNCNNANLGYAVLINSNLEGASLIKSKLDNARLKNVNLSNGDLSYSSLYNANLYGVSLRAATLKSANFTKANLTLANLSWAYLRGTNLNNTLLSETDFYMAKLGNTLLGQVNLSTVKNLETCDYSEPCIIDFATLTASNNLPLEFLRGIGLPDHIIEYLPSLRGQALSYYSCFISYSTKDEEFAKRLHEALQNNGVRCWFAPHDIQGGKKLYEQIDTAIRVHDKLLLILSKNSMKSEWVKTEIAKARKKEAQTGKRVLFPISLVDYEAIKEWECFDSDRGKDSAREIREYYIPSFKDWKDHDKFKIEFEKLLRDLKGELE